jgi:Zn finger protein HypA/HybF involved in hydrogenase expression
MIQIGMPLWLHIWLNFPIYLLIGSIFLLVCSWACKYKSKQGQKPERTYYTTRTSATHPSRKKYRTASVSKTIQLVRCPECEATIQANEVVCPHCGSSRPVCMVCHHTIEYGEPILFCPHCNAKAHRVHLLEYLKVKGTCSNCQADLDEFELRES